MLIYFVSCRFFFLLRENDFSLLQYESDERTTDLRTWERCRYGAWKDVLTAFFKTHFENIRAAKLTQVQKYRAPQRTDKHQINYIIGMYGTLKRFIQDHQSFVRNVMARGPPPFSGLDPSLRRKERGAPKDWPPLGENEVLRLQRGFLRYELCSRLTVAPTWKTTEIRHPGISDFPWAFLSKYVQRWEEEEIRCAWTYVLRQYEMFVQDMVTEFRCDVRRLSRKARHAPDSELVLAPKLVPGLRHHFEVWTYDMSMLGLPMLQQFLRSGFDDQRRFLKNTALSFPGVLFWCPEGSWQGTTLESELQHSGYFNNLPTTNGANPIYAPITLEIADCSTLRDYKPAHDPRTISARLKEIGWVFWEDNTRLENYLELPDPREPRRMRRDFTVCLQDLCSRHPVNRFEIEDRYPEQSMYVTKEDYEGELSAKYPVSPATPGGEYFFVDRIWDISDWSSKEVSPAFREICSGMPASG